MGKRSISSTKGGKYMNPTDQARKEARRKELKRNKRQRMAVRQAVLKNKDPKEIIKELDKIDKMEFNVDAPAPLSEKVLMEKRKKLKETLDRVLKLYEKEDPDYWADIRRTEAEYDKRRTSLISYYESVKHAEEVTVDDIPLPQNMLPETMPDQIPLPPGLDELPPAPASGILKKTTLLDGIDAELLDQQPCGPPGVPPGLPPDIELPEDDLALKNISSHIVPELSDEASSLLNPLSSASGIESVIANPHIHPTPAGIPVMLVRPPPLRVTMQPPLAAIRLPPGPPPGLPPRLRFPPGPPPGLPPRMMRPPAPLDATGAPISALSAASNNNVLSAAPQLRDSRQQSATIEAKPQIRNLSADVTRFVPSALRIKRGDKRRTDKKQVSDQDRSEKDGAAQQKPTKDDAYAMFMSEMKDLL